MTTKFLLYIVISICFTGLAVLASDFGEPLYQMQKGLYTTQPQQVNKKEINNTTNDDKKNLQKSTAKIKLAKETKIKQEKQKVLFTIENRISILERNITTIKKSNLPKKEKKVKIKQLEVELKKQKALKGRAEDYYDQNLKKL